MFLCSECIAGGEYDTLISPFSPEGSMISNISTGGSGSLGNKVNQDINSDSTSVKHWTVHTNCEGSRIVWNVDF